MWHDGPWWSYVSSSLYAILCCFLTWQFTGIRVRSNKLAPGTQLMRAPIIHQWKLRKIVPLRINHQPRLVNFCDLDYDAQKKCGLKICLWMYKPNLCPYKQVQTQLYHIALSPGPCSELQSSLHTVWHSVAVPINFLFWKSSSFFLQSLYAWVLVIILCDP